MVPSNSHKEEHIFADDKFSYYIRSAIEPNLFWVYDLVNRCIITSSVYRTKFTIRRKTPLPFECRPEDDILIDEDDINIFIATPGWENRHEPNIMIVKTARNTLVGTNEASVVEAGTFKFGMFDRGFGVLTDKSWDGKEVFACARVNGGERWEFVQ
jgi:hypothetical protein